MTLDDFHDKKSWLQIIDSRLKMSWLSWGMATMTHDFWLQGKQHSIKVDSSGCWGACVNSYSVEKKRKCAETLWSSMFYVGIGSGVSLKVNFIDELWYSIIPLECNKIIIILFDKETSVPKRCGLGWNLFSFLWNHLVLLAFGWLVIRKSQSRPNVSTVHHQLPSRARIIEAVCWKNVVNGGLIGHFRMTLPHAWLGLSTIRFSMDLPPSFSNLCFFPPGLGWL